MENDGVRFDDIQNPEQDKAFDHDQEPPEETVGDLMKKSGSDGIKFWVIVLSALVYVAGIVYAEVHGLTMLQKGVRPDLRIWATMGMIAAGITAGVLPVALKVWTIEAKQRIAAYMFYALDFAFLMFNAFTDFNTNTGQQLTGWAQSYVTYVLPASPIIVAALWALVWELDPSVRKKVMLLSLRAAMQEKLMQGVADAAKGQHVTKAVHTAASKEVDLALWELFGAKPADGYYVMDDEPKRRNLLRGFFGLLSSWARRVVSTNTVTSSQPSDLDGPQP